MTPPISNPLAAITSAAIENALCSKTDETISELLEDFGALRFLIDDLANSAFVKDESAEQNWLRTNFSQTVGLLKTRVRKSVDSIEKARSDYSPKQLPTAIAKAARESHAIKSALRGAYRQRGILLCGQDWQSPVYDASVPFISNRLSQGIAEHYWDYKRDGHLDAVVYEQQFLAEYASHLGSNKLKAFLTNSGMAAFSTVMHWLCDELGHRGSAFAIQPMYFENLHIARAFVPNLVQCAPKSTEELLIKLRSEEPSIVLFDPITNCGEVLEHDIDAVLSWARNEANHEVALVIDTTCVPTVLLENDLLKNLPSHISVIFVESLAKHHQFGMDTVTGGVIVAHMKEGMQESLWKTRARLGTNISDASVGSLPRPSREQLERRMQRHSRNLARLARTIEQELLTRNNVIESLSWLHDGVQNDPSFHSSCMTVRFQKQCRSIQQYREFETKVLELAKAKNHPVVFGTSFGFDISRMYVTAPATRFEEPFLRVAIGTETGTEIGILAEIMLQAGEALAAQWLTNSHPTAKRTATTPADLLPPAEKDREFRIDKAGLKSSVFTGEDALKNYLCPANYPATPLIELPAALNPFRAQGVRIMAKMMPMVPLMNIKSLPAFSMLNEAAKRGDLKDVQNVIESSSSNTVLSLSVMAKLFGIDDTYAIVDHSIAPSLTRMLRLFGIEIFMHPAAGHEMFGKLQPRSERATKMGGRPGWFNPGQYTNPDNPLGFARWLAPDIWAQTQGRLDLLSCGLGTCGTMFGITRELRKLNPKLEVLSCCPNAGEAVPGPRERSLLKDVTFEWEGMTDEIIEVSATESFKASVKLLRHGVLGGPSSGMNYAGLLKQLEQKQARGELDRDEGNKDDIWCVFLCCDSPLPHVDEYYDALGDEFFPTVHPVPEEDEPARH